MVVGKEKVPDPPMDVSHTRSLSRRLPTSSTYHSVLLFPLPATLLSAPSLTCLKLNFTVAIVADTYRALPLGTILSSLQMYKLI